MTIPNVIMNWCRKKARCNWCRGEDGSNIYIEIGQPMVTVIFWNKGNENSRRWNVQHCYHPQCWVEQGLDYLARNPFVPHKRGRKCLLSAEDTRKRFLLVRRFHALEQRKKHIIVGYPNNAIVEANLAKQMVEIMMEVVLIGGVPKLWAEKLG